VIGTVSSEVKARLAREFGCEHPIVTRDYRFADAVRRQFDGVDVLVDGIGDAAREENLAALARRAHWISLGQASGVLRPIASDELGGEVDHLLPPGGVRLRRQQRQPRRTRAAGLAGARGGHAARAADRAPRARRRCRSACPAGVEADHGALVLMA
jgi:NADPH:quinone reductase-like Zn-dependent oxidoreductase